ncbi:hypothetical protein AB0C11_44200, partial [Streptomyces sp. NPDC039016]
MASYDGKLHAVYPSAEGTDNLRHTTWTKDGGWTEPKDLVGHESKRTPALLTFKDGPAGSQREALLLVHRGVALYVRTGSGSTCVCAVRRCWFEWRWKTCTNPLSQQWG